MYIFKFGGFTRGHHNYAVTYSAGYASVPDDLQLAIKMAVKFVYDRRNDSSIGIQNYSLGHVNIKYDSVLPKEVLDIISRYKKQYVFSAT